MKNLVNKKSLPTLFWVIAILFFSYKMLLIILPYRTGEWEVDFLLTKQFIIHLDHYRLAFYTHITSSLIILASGIFLFSKKVLKQMPRLHRVTGKMYVTLVLIIAAPSGLVMAYYANGGWIAQMSFSILSILWWWFTFKGFQTIRAKQIVAHKKWMVRSYALTLSAITLRIMQMTLGYFLNLDPIVQYIFVAWISWMVNLVIAELIIYYSFKERKNSNLMFNLKLLNNNLSDQRSEAF